MSETYILIALVSTVWL